MIYEMLIELDPDTPAQRGPRTAQAVYTDADVDQYGGHEEYAAHILESSNGFAAGFGLPSHSAPKIGPAGARVTVWERPQFTGVPTLAGTPMKTWDVPPSPEEA